jgi:hypothetical protein
VRDRAEMEVRHVADSLSVLPFVAGATVLDVGTGAGLPGLVLAIADPSRRYTLLDSNGKKVRFCEHAIAALGVTNAVAVQDREDSEEILDLAQVPQVLSRLQVVFHFFTIRGRHGKTQAAHRDVPPPMRLAPRWQECPRCVAARQSIFQKIFFLRSIDKRPSAMRASRLLLPKVFKECKQQLDIVGKGRCDHSRASWRAWQLFSRKDLLMPIMSMHYAHPSFNNRGEQEAGFQRETRLLVI